MSDALARRSTFIGVVNTILLLTELLIASVNGDNSCVTVTPCIGATGPTGAAGIPEPQGVTGVQGKPGSQGLRKATWCAGAR